MTSPSTDRRYGLSSGTAIKAPCIAATTGDITLSGEQTIDGVAVVSGDRVLVKNQTDTTENGIYDADTGSWTRSVDANGNYDLVTGTIVVVISGTANSETSWMIASTGDITIGTSAIVWTAIVPPSVFASDSALVSFLQAGSGAGTITSQAKMRQIVSVLDFFADGAALPMVDPTGAVDSTAGIQAALDTGKSVYVPTGTYKITSTLRFQVDGQIMYGSGAKGDDEVTIQSPTRFLWATAASATDKVVSFRPAATGRHVGDCQLRDICVDADSKAGIGIEVYDIANDPGLGFRGCWRNVLDNVFVKNATVVGVEWGYTGAAPQFANDCSMIGGAIYNCETGWRYIGSTLTYNKVTVQSNTTCGGHLYGGAVAGMVECVYTANEVDFIGEAPQLLTVTGGWCENSVSGVVQENGASGTYTFQGVFLHTFNSTFLMDFNGSAGAKTVAGCHFPASLISGTNNLIIGLNDTYGINGMGSTAIAFTNSLIGSSRQTLPQAMFGGAFPVGQIQAQTSTTVEDTVPWVVDFVSGGTKFYGILNVLARNAAVATQRSGRTYAVHFFGTTDGTTGDEPKLTLLQESTGIGGSWGFTATCALVAISTSANKGVFSITTTAGSSSYVMMSAIGMGGF